MPDASNDGRPQRLLIIGDEHFPYSIPAYFNVKHPSQETPFINFAKDFAPDVLVHLGDQLDLDVIAHWNRGKPRLVEGMRLSTVYDGYNQVLDREERHLKSLKTRVMLWGNHDQWVDDLLDEQPALESLIGIRENLHLKSRGYKCVEFRKHYKIGKLNIIHGNYRSGVGAQYHAKAIAQIYCANVIYGHYHTSQVYTAITPFDQHPYQATCIGTMARVNPAWKRNEPAAWLNSFWAGYVFPNGNFHGESVSIINGRFVFDGQVYK